MTRRLTRNAGKCAKCGDVIESTHRHDFRHCKCGAIFIDGGLAYQRYGWMDAGDFIDMAEYAEDDE